VSVNETGEKCPVLKSGPNQVKKVKEKKRKIGEITLKLKI